MAQPLQVPAQIEHDDLSYRLAFRQDSSSQGLYEYTTGGETVDNWTHLLTVNYARGNRAAPVDWLNALKRVADRENPRPHYSMSVEGGHGYAQLIYTPRPGEARYESNVHKSFHYARCGGLVVLQVAVREALDPVAGDNQLRVVARDNTLMRKALTASSWQPDCRPSSE